MKLGFSYFENRFHLKKKHKFTVAENTTAEKRKSLLKTL